MTDIVNTNLNDKSSAVALAHKIGISANDLALSETRIHNSDKQEQTNDK